MVLRPLTLFEVGGDPQNGLQMTPNFVTFPISIWPIWKAKKIFGFSQLFWVSIRGWWQTPPPRHLTYIFNPVPNRVNMIEVKTSVMEIFSCFHRIILRWFRGAGVEGVGVNKCWRKYRLHKCQITPQVREVVCRKRKQKLSIKMNR